MVEQNSVRQDETHTPAALKVSGGLPGEQSRDLLVRRRSTDPVRPSCRGGPLGSNATPRRITDNQIHVCRILGTIAKEVPTPNIAFYGFRRPRCVMNQPRQAMSLLLQFLNVPR